MEKQKEPIMTRPVYKRCSVPYFNPAPPLVQFPFPIEIKPHVGFDFHQPNSILPPSYPPSLMAYRDFYPAPNHSTKTQPIVSMQSFGTPQNACTEQYGRFHTMRGPSTEDSAHLTTFLVQNHPIPESSLNLAVTKSQVYFPPNSLPLTWEPQQEFAENEPLPEQQSEDNSTSLKTNGSSLFQRLKYFAKLATLIGKILKDEPLDSNDVDIPPEDKEVLIAFLNKRYRLKEAQKLSRGNDLTPSGLLTLPSLLRKFNYGKRKEENMKLVFNWVFKFLKTQLSASCPEKLDKHQVDYLFYTHYFRKIAEEHELNILNFYKPNFVKPIRNSEKTFNANFIKNIQLSSCFMSDFNIALDDYMMHEYKHVIDKKLYAIFSKWESKIDRESSRTAGVLSLARSIAGSRKCKLPWTMTEIQLAISCVKTELNYRH